MRIIRSFVTLTNEEYIIREARTGLTATRASSFLTERPVNTSKVIVCGDGSVLFRYTYIFWLLISCGTKYQRKALHTFLLG